MSDEQKKAMCPKVIPYGWWWKKHFSYFRKRKEMMDAIMLHDWMNGGYELYLKMLAMTLDMSVMMTYDLGCKINYTSK